MTDSWRTWLPETTDDLDDDDGDLATAVVGEEFVDDDPLREIKLAVRERAQTVATRNRILRAVAGVGAAAALVAAGAIGLTTMQRNDSHAAPPAPAPVAATTAKAPVWCAENRSATVVVSNGKGHDSAAKVSGPDLILFQQWQWYVAKNADASRSVLAADAQAADPELARAAVAAIPAGTKHCTTITTLGPDRFDVQIDEKHADGTSAHWQQTVTTAAQDGRTVITSVTAGGAQ